MANRFLVWLSAGVLAAGVSMGALAGAGLAVADDGAADSGEASSSADSSDSQDTPADSPSDKEADTTGSDGPADADGDPADEAGDAPDGEEQEPVDEEDPADEDQPTDGDEVPEEEAEEPSDTEDTTDESAVDTSRDTDGATRETEAPASDDHAEVVDRAPLAREHEPVAPGVEEVEPAPPPPVAVDVAPVAAEVQGVDPASAVHEPETARLMMSAVDVEEAAAPKPTLLNVIGTLAWSVLDFVVKMVVGPPAVPPGSTVTAGRSTLEIDCGDGYTTDADWYYPKNGQPEKFIYFQHGFLARAGIYNLTLAALAERNNAIVVAPSITSNYFACDGCSLTADPMHAAVARLFEGDRAALLASAEAAGFEGTLPTQFVFSGQSAGSMLAAGAAGYYYDSAPAQQKGDLVGVLLFDGSAANGALARALDKMPSTLPVLHIAGVPTVINNGGDASQVLLAKRPGQFNGVQLVGGAHSDAFQSDAYFGLVQAFVSLTFGASAPENVEAVQVLSRGWLTDMYADPATRTGIYGDPGQPGQTVIDIPTDAGLARAYVLPGPPPALSPLERFFAALLQSINSNDFVTCSTEPSTSAGACSGSSAT